MSGILKNYDLAITAGGMTLLELACVGIPSLIICGERFEIETAKLLEKYGFGKNLGFGKNVSTKKLNSEISAIINDFNTRKSMKLCGQKLIDGNGCHIGFFSNSNFSVGKLKSIKEILNSQRKFEEKIFSWFVKIFCMKFPEDIFDFSLFLKQKHRLQNFI